MTAKHIACGSFLDKQLLVCGSLVHLSDALDQALIAIARLSPYDACHYPVMGMGVRCPNASHRNEQRFTEQLCVETKTQAGAADECRRWRRPCDDVYRLRYTACRRFEHSIRRVFLTYVEQNFSPRTHHRSGGTRLWQVNATVVAELARLLLAHPGGLRRWSVMRAMRKTWEHANLEVSLKFEDEVERHFRYFSADDECAKNPEQAQYALFFRPADKAGEVWAATPERTRAWLAAHAPSAV